MASSCPTVFSRGPTLHAHTQGVDLARTPRRAQENRFLPGTDRHIRGLIGIYLSPPAEKSSSSLHDAERRSTEQGKDPHPAEVKRGRCADPSGTRKWRCGVSGTSARRRTLCPGCDCRSLQRTAIRPPIAAPTQRRELRLWSRERPVSSCGLSNSPPRDSCVNRAEPVIPSSADMDLGYPSEISPGRRPPPGRRHALRPERA